MGALRERNFRFLFVGQTASALGNTLVPVALAFGILQLTHSPADLGYVLGAESGALVLFVLAGGVIADRFPRRAVMIIADSVRCVSQAALGVLLIIGHAPFWAILILVVFGGIGAALFTPASTGLTPSLVKPEHLQQANGLQQTSSAAAGIAGPAAAGILVVSVGPGWAILGDAATFLVSVILLAQLRLTNVPRPVTRHWAHELRAGWHDFWNRKWFRTVVIGASVFMLFYSAYTVLGPVLSEDHYGGAGAWAIISTSSAVGAAVGGLFAGRIRPRHPLRAAIPLIALACLAPAALGFQLPVPIVAIAAAADGVSIVLFETIWQTTIQRQVPEHLLSRASSYDYFGSLIAYPLGLTLAGPLAAAFGAQYILLIVAAMLLLLTPVLLFAPSVRNLADVGDGPPEVAAGEAAA